MAFGDRAKNLIANLQGSDWYLGKNLNMERGEAIKILLAGGPAAAAIQYALKQRGVSQSEIDAAIGQSQAAPDYYPRKKQDLTPLYIGMGVLAIILITKK